MNKRTAIVIGVLVVVFAGLVGLAVLQSNTSNKKYDQYDLYSVIEGNADNGGIADHVKGNKNAKVLIFEYSDYQCPGCAATETKVNKLLEKYGDKIGLVQRTYVLSYHQNGKAAAAAAEAAGLQGYWDKYGDYLFKNQNDWEKSDASTRTQQFENYLMKVSDNKADLEKFRSDINSDAVIAKVNFDNKISERAGKSIGDLPYTPSFFMNGKYLDWAGQANSVSNDLKVSNPDKKDFVDFMSSQIDPLLK